MRVINIITPCVYRGPSTYRTPLKIGRIDPPSLSLSLITVITQNLSRNRPAFGRSTPPTGVKSIDSRRHRHYRSLASFIGDLVIMRDSLDAQNNEYALAVMVDLTSGQTRGSPLSSINFANRFTRNDKLLEDVAIRFRFRAGTGRIVGISVPVCR